MTPPVTKSRKRQLTAKTADKHVLYQESVQDAEAEARFVDRTFKKARGRRATSLREDFCGTALLCSEWVKLGRERTATGLDLDREVLDWGRARNLAPLGDAASRVTLLERDVRASGGGRHDVTVAFNFSYWIFKTRDELRAYFASARKGLVDDGVFLLDAYGGTEAGETQEEPRRGNGFTYVWHQAEFNPITHDVTNHIHFEFPDGSKQHRAFTYEWRFWTLPELTEVLREAGFSRVEVWWDHAPDEDDEDYRPTKVAENQPGWLAYLVAER